MNKQTSKSTPSTDIARNKKAYHDYFIEVSFEAGIAFEGWEVKSIRAGRVQLKESYVLLKNNEAWLLGAHISPLLSASSHIQPDPLRTRKLLLNRREIDKLQKAKDRQGYAIVPLNLHWSRHHIKLTIAIAKGKKLHDKRQSAKEKDWQRQQERNFKQ
ncbi:MAG: SsrA-binding protein [Coxiellaceae bacterium]|nr:SsrA-binding protein [Coxiellaceae bacterium]|tara:strand:+ start:1136 stop:1609 length:474 start_codon:yes stop_codon:yes gene_type:complete